MSNAVDRCFEYQLSQAKHYKIGICCFPIKHASLRNKSKDWLVRNQNIRAKVQLYFFLLTVVSVSLHNEHPDKRVGLEHH
jgi:hypothetical protein